jgi:hypothetical protein
VPEWDRDSPRSQKNLDKVLKEIVLRAERREIPTLEAARLRQSQIMEGLDVLDRRYVGAFRGEPGLERTHVRVGANYGVVSADVSEELARFETKLQVLVAELDALLPVDDELDADQSAAVIDLCAHGCMLNGSVSTHLRTAMAGLPDSGPIASPFAMDFPPFIRLRPSPNAGYGDAGANAMQSDWKPTAVVFRRLLSEFLAEV